LSSTTIIKKNGAVGVSAIANEISEGSNLHKIEGDFAKMFVWNLQLLKWLKGRAKNFAERMDLQSF